MKQKQFIQSIEDSFKKAVEIVKAKNHDYATEIDPFKNFKYAEYCGVSIEKAILVRVSDKFARISNLLDKEAKVKDEKLEDTLLDMINYLAILKTYLEDKNA